jgi:hypothetical protein
LRLSFGPSEVASGDGEECGDETFTPKKSSLSRQAIEKNAVRKSLAHSMSSERLPTRPTGTEDRPSYSKDYLSELRSSTPSTPKDLHSLSEVEDNSDKDPLDIAGKFGTRGSTPDDPHIPSAAEIREKKERRARLAKEQEYMSLDGSDDENMDVSLLPRKLKPETRLVREDDDIAEGFDEFVEDGRISLGKKAEKEERRRRRAEIAELINEAEGHSSGVSDDSEAEDRAAFDEAQTQAGKYSTSTAERHQSPTGPKTPPKITPLPLLTASLERLQATLCSMEEARKRMVKRMEDLMHEKEEVANREVEIQRLLKEAGERYEQVRAEAGMGGGTDTPVTAEDGQIGLGSRIIVHRGLESFGNTPLRKPTAEDDWGE